MEVENFYRRNSITEKGMKPSKRLKRREERINKETKRKIKTP